MQDALEGWFCSACTGTTPESHKVPSRASEASQFPGRGDLYFLTWFHPPFNQSRKPSAHDRLAVIGSKSKLIGRGETQHVAGHILLSEEQRIGQALIERRERHTGVDLEV